jgi:hypothetical protein
VQDLGHRPVVPGVVGSTPSAMIPVSRHPHPPVEPSGLPSPISIRRNVVPLTGHSLRRHITGPRSQPDDAARSISLERWRLGRAQPTTAI